MTDPRASVQVSDLARDLYRMGPAARRQLRASFARIGQAAQSDARSRARWSRRIPAAIALRPITDMNRGRVGFELRVSARQAPHARAFEGITTRNDRFRHPVFGNRDVWVDQQARPFLWPAVHGRAPEAQRAATEAFEQAARDAGFR